MSDDPLVRAPWWVVVLVAMVGVGLLAWAFIGDFS